MVEVAELVNDFTEQVTQIRVGCTCVSLENYVSAAKPRRGLNYCFPQCCRFPRSLERLAGGSSIYSAIEQEY